MIDSQVDLLESCKVLEGVVPFVPYSIVVLVADTFYTVHTSDYAKASRAAATIWRDKHVPGAALGEIIKNAQKVTLPTPKISERDFIHFLKKVYRLNGEEA